jgi:hypothetical protein
MTKYLPFEYLPSEMDVVCGRGKAYANLPGNKRYMGILRSNLRCYVAAEKRFDKTLVVATVVSEVRAKGARFIKKDYQANRFFELSTIEVHEKTGHALRDLLRTTSGTTRQQSVQAKNKTIKKLTSAINKPVPTLLLSLDNDLFNISNDTYGGDEISTIDSLDNLLLAPLDFLDEKALPSAPELIEDFETSSKFDGSSNDVPDQIISVAPINIGPGMTPHPLSLRTMMISSPPPLSRLSPRQVVSYNLDELLSEEAMVFTGCEFGLFL